MLESAGMTGFAGRGSRAGARNSARIGDWRVTRLGAALVASLLGVANAADDIAVRVDSGRLSVHTRGEVEVGRVLDSVSQETGADLQLDPVLAAGRISITIEGMELERALRELVARIPGAGGHTIVYAGDGAEPSRIVRVTIFGGGGSATGTPPPREADAVRGEPDAVRGTLEPPAPSGEELERQRLHLVERGVSEETARSFVEITAELPRLRQTPGAAEALYDSERYRRMIQEIAEAQGKGSAPDEP